MQYSPDFLNHRNILNADDKIFLSGQASRCQLSDFLQDSRNFDEVAVDFVYTSAKIEGNTYSRLDTDKLLRLGITAGGKSYSDAVMLVNLRQAFNKVMEEEKQPHDFDFLCDLHQVLMKDLLPVSEQGLPRASGVQIGGTSYTPLADPLQLRTEAKFLLSEAEKHDNPFEKAIHLHCNLAYLQLFRDGNKRTARMMQTASLVQDGILPLFFDDRLIDKYISATVDYYETGNYQSYVEFFKENYQRGIDKLVGVEKAIPVETKAEFDRRIALIPSLKGSVRVQGIFVNEALNELDSRPAEYVNWYNVGRKVIEKSLEAGYPKDEIVSVLSKYSPSAITAEAQKATTDDINMLSKTIGQKQEQTKDIGRSR